MLESLLCQDESPTFLGLFDLSTAPVLLYYSYIPIALASVFFGFFIYYQDKKSLQSKLLLGTSVLFALWVVNILVQWIASYHTLLMLGWQLTALFEVPIFILSLYFLHVFIYKNNIKFSYQLILAGITFVIIVALPTSLNIASYDPTECQGAIGQIWTYIYIFEIISIVSVALIGFKALFSKQKTISNNEILLVVTGMMLFLGFFSFSNILGELTQFYEINLFGPLGMVFFLALMSYVISHYKTFNTKILSAQILVFVLALLTFSLLFVREDPTIRVAIICATLGLVNIIGYYVIKGIKLEVKQREKIEKLAVELEKANTQLRELDTQKDELLSIVSHQLATPVSSVKWYTEMLIDGDMGKITKQQKEHLTTMMGVTENLSDLVSMILDVSRIQLGRMHVDKQDLDMNVFFKEILEIIQPKAVQKNLKFEAKLPIKLPTAKLDKRYTHMTIENLLSNAIKYTSASGSVIFTVEIKGNTIFCKVKDSGMGIPKSEQEKIFGKMYRASNVRNSVDGNGFGLYVAKGAVEAQGGKIYFESKEGVGTTFFVELPIK